MTIIGRELGEYGLEALISYRDDHKASIMFLRKDKSEFVSQIVLHEEELVDLTNFLVHMGHQIDGKLKEKKESTNA
jgi:hypothetical protein